MAAITVLKLLDENRAQLRVYLNLHAHTAEDRDDASLRRLLLWFLRGDELLKGRGSRARIRSERIELFGGC